VNKPIRRSIILAIPVCFLLTLFFVIGHSFRASAEKPLYWVTVQESELAHVRQKIQSRGGRFDYDVTTRQDDIAVLRMDELQMLDLSRNMHDEFHKCAGFSSHESFEEALAAAGAGFRTEAVQAPQAYSIDNQANVNPLIAEAAEASTRQVILDLSAFPNRRYNQPSGLDSATWIKNKWTTLAAGRSDITVEFFTHTTAVSPQPSVVLTIQGTTLPNEVVILGAHQDSINSASQTASAPGADDDASGVASLTEAIRIIAAKNFKPQRTVKFMAYAAEEVGLRGSNAIAADFLSRGVNIAGVLQLDMTNYKSASSPHDFVLVTDFTNAAQNQFIRDLSAAYFPTYVIANTTCGYKCSDHASWSDRGYAASFPHESTLANSNQQIHKATDTISQSGGNANHALKFAKLALVFTGELAKGSIATAPPIKARFDYDGDGKTDVSVFRPDDHFWYLNNSTAGYSGAAWGLSTDRIVPGDYDGDGKTDMSVYRDGSWYIYGTTQGFFAAYFGNATDIPQPEDYDGDGKTDVAVFRPSDGTWYIQKSGGGLTITQFGNSTDRPAAADFDGDGKADITVFRDGFWYQLLSQQGYSGVHFGMATDRPVAADFDADGKADPAVYRDGMWYVLGSQSGYTGVHFGLPTDIPVTGDYDGDGKSDAAVFRDGMWYVLRSADSSLFGVQFGMAGDKPTPAAFR